MSLNSVHESAEVSRAAADIQTTLLQSLVAEMKKRLRVNAERGEPTHLYRNLTVYKEAEDPVLSEASLVELSDRIGEMPEASELCTVCHDHGVWITEFSVGQTELPIQVENGRIMKSAYVLECSFHSMALLPRLNAGE